jgi:hypothetical protein
MQREEKKIQEWLSTDELYFKAHMLTSWESQNRDKNMLFNNKYTPLCH